MSVGGGKSKSKTKTWQQETNSKTLDPALARALYGNVERAKGLTYAPFTGQRVADFNPSQILGQQGMVDLAGRHVGAEHLSAAAAAARSATNFRPSEISAGGYRPMDAAPSQVSRSAVRDVRAAPISSEAIQHYFDPYQQSVIDASLGDIERQRRIQRTYEDARALRNNAFGGTGAEVARSLLDENFARQSAMTSAQLRSQGWNNALTAAQSDAARRSQADVANQGMDWSVANANATFGQQASMFNAGQTTDANRFAAEQHYAAQLANQQAQQAGAQFNLSGAGELATIAGLQRQAAVSDMELLGQVGAEQQALEQSKLDAAYEAWRNGWQMTKEQQQLLSDAISLIPDHGSEHSEGSGWNKGSSYNFGFSAGGR